MNPRQRRVGPHVTGFGGGDELAAGVGPAADVDHHPPSIQPFVLGQRIGLKVARVVGEELLRAGGRVIRGEGKNDVGEIGVAEVHPQVRPVGTVRADHPQFDAGIITVNHPRLHHSRLHQLVQGVEQVGRLGHPIAQRGRGEGDPGPGQLPGQAVERGMVSKLGGDDVGQQARAAESLGHRADLGGSGGLHPLGGGNLVRGAMGASVGLLDRAQDEEPRRLQVQLLRGLGADADARLATTRAALLGRGEVVDHVPAFQMVGQGRPAVRRGLAGLVRRGGRGRRPAFRAAAEAVLQGGSELGAQFGVLGPQPRYLGEQLADHRLQGRHVVGQRRFGGEGGGVHASINPARAGG